MSGPLCDTLHTEGGKLVYLKPQHAGQTPRCCHLLIPRPLRSPRLSGGYLGNAAQMMKAWATPCWVCCGVRSM